MLAVNHSTKEGICASGDSGWSLSSFHCKIDSYVKVGLFYTYKIVITDIPIGKSIFECWLTLEYTKYLNIHFTSSFNPD